MHYRFQSFLAASSVGLLSVSTFLAGQGAQTKAPTPVAAPAPRGQTTAAPGAPVAAATRGQAAVATPARPARIAGMPNLSGLWQAMSGANWDIQDHSTEPGPFYQLGAIMAVPAGQGVVEGNEIPYRPEALAQRNLNRLNRWSADPEIKCYMPGIPRATYMPYPFQIVQGTNSIAFAYEYATSNRVVRMTNHQKAPVPSWMGWSNGRWEGDTLVVEVTGNNDQTWFDRSGNFHSEEMKVTERYKLRSPDVIDYEATIEDPKTFTRPWKISLPLYRRLEKNAKILEYKCVEYAEELIYGHLRKPTN
jgi:hypothetical protein